MNSSKVIDISKSSLIGLKAELLKKQEEVKKFKELYKDCFKPATQQKKASGSQKPNKGVKERSLKDTEQTEDDLDVLRKSRQLLEAKAKLYDKLKLKEGDGGTKSQYLIDFDLKQEIYSNKNLHNEEEENTSHISEDEDRYSDSNSDADNDWVDFVDTLGRSRRCLKTDLPEMKVKDAKLASSLRPPTPPPPPPEVTPELLSWDMQREMVRKKWEEQETLLLEKKDIHYQDVLFEEARPHGVGYFGFSTDENERLRQQQDLKNMRKETIEQQEAALGLQARRQQQLEARLAAARRRKRERLGLPPEDPDLPKAEVSVSNPEEEQHNLEKIEDLEESIKKIAPVRPWDIGKVNVSFVMSQEEWVEKKRLERPEEFAPLPGVVQAAEDRAPRLKTVNKHKPQKNNSNKTESDCLRPSFQNPKRMACVTNSNLSQHSTERTRCGPSLESLKSNNNVQTAELSETTCYHPSSEQFNHDNTYTKCSESSATTINHVFPTIKSRKPTSEDIDDLLSVTKEKCDGHYETKNLGGTFVRRQEIRDRIECFGSVVNSSKVTRERDSNILFSKTIASNIKPVTEVVKKIRKEVVNIDGDLNLHQRNSKGRSIEDNYTSDALHEAAFNNERSTSKRKRAEIPPPSSMTYYNDGATPNKQHSSSKTDLSESISVGLNFLKSKEKKETRVKGLLDII